ncbi:MAG: 16S rRNA (guanine(527)-N(7))-methyltransferase RsmG [Burkholderiales bacterium]
MTGRALRAGAAELGVALSDDAVAKLIRYLELLAKWNRVFNLTAIHDERDWVAQHLLDSLAVIPHLPAGNVVDVGSGAGLPGVPIAVACPQRQVMLLDSNQKKGAFLQQTVSELGLQRTCVEISRVESFRPEKTFAVVISRAFAELVRFVQAAKHLCAPEGRLVAMKGAHPRKELALLPSVAIDKVLPLVVPGLNAQRHLVLIDPAHL